MRDKLSLNVLVLSGTYEALHICNARRALVLVICGKAHAVDESDVEVHSPSTTFLIPEVIRLHSTPRLPYKPVVFSRKNVFLRDNHKCQYCGERFKESDLTIDHVLPTSRGGKNIWTNVVAACHYCNNHKADRTLEESDMKLLTRPKKINSMTFLQILRKMGQANQNWRKYLYFDDPGVLVSRG